MEPARVRKPTSQTRSRGKRLRQAAGGKVRKGGISPTASEWQRQGSGWERQRLPVPRKRAHLTLTGQLKFRAGARRSRPARTVRSAGRADGPPHIPPTEGGHGRETEADTRRRISCEILCDSYSTGRPRRRNSVPDNELHDGLCQQLTGMAFSAELLARKLGAKAPDVVPQVRKLADEVDQAITQTRALARGLNPVEIHADGLASALDDLARKVAESYSVSCRFRRDGDGEAAVGDTSAATHLYRIAQEAISNAIRHGKAKEVELMLQSAGGGVSLTVADGGVGFEKEPGAPGPREKSEGIGRGRRTPSAPARPMSLQIIL